MKKYIIILMALLCLGQLQAQVGIGTNTPNANAVLEVASTSQGIGFPQLTTAQRDAIVSPEPGLTIYNTTTNTLQTNAGTSGAPDWKTWLIDPSSKGTAIVSAYTCSTDSAGIMYTGKAVSGVTQTITATVTTVGTYNISAVANGLTFTATGTFAGTGAQNVVLTATGTPTSSGSFTYILNTTPNCSFTRTIRWTPAELTTSLWLDAADASTVILNGSNVSRWDDKSGNGRNAVQNMAANQPVYSATAFPGSLPGLLFDGSNDIMDVSITTPIQNQTHGTYWVFSRSGAGTGDNYRPFIGIRAAGGNGVDYGALHYVRTDNSRGASYPYYFAPGTFNYDNATPSYISNTGYVMSFQINVTGWGVWRNGTLEGTTNGISTPNANNIGYSIGGQYAPNRRTNGVIAEAITLNVTDVATRERIEGYLAHKWGLTANLPVGHPFKSTAP